MSKLKQHKHKWGIVGQQEGSFERVIMLQICECGTARRKTYKIDHSL